MMRVQKAHDLLRSKASRQADQVQFGRHEAIGT